MADSPLPNSTQYLPLKNWYRISGFSWFFAIFIIACLWVFLSHSLRSGVYEAYIRGSQNIIEHVNPYPQTEEHFHHGYKYSPLFGVLFQPLVILPLKVGSFLWRLLNLGIFLSGLAFFISISFNDRGGVSAFLKRHWHMVVLILLTYTPLIISLKHAQANPMVCGMILFALASYCQGKERWAGVFLGLASNFKIFPLTYGLLLLLNFRWAYWRAFFGTLAASLILPVLAVGWNWNLQLHQYWLASLIADFDTSDKLSLWRFLQINFGVGYPGAYRVFTFFNIVLLCALYRKSSSALSSSGLRRLYPLCALFILLFNHRTETELFVLINPVYIILFLSILSKHSKGKTSTIEISVLMVGHFFITLAYSDLIPDPATEWLNQFRVRVLGVLIFYIYFVWSALLNAKTSST